MTIASIDKDAIKKKYAAERDKRVRSDGNEQYQRLGARIAEQAADPHTPMESRAPVTDHVTFAFVGAGFAGLVVGARLKEAGIEDVRIIDKGGDVGGTWYWNRYPGAQCDTAAMIYLPLLEETGHVPSEKYVHGPEIRGQCERIARQYNLYESALFHTEVTSMEWQEGEKVWRITTNRGDDFTAKYVGIGTGPLHVAKLPGIEGVADFEGKSFHTSRWDYEYTGGNAEGAPLDKLADKRVAIIGTGATAVQCVPHLARAAGSLFVFQRTPSSVDERKNHPIDPKWFADTATPGWQKRWLDNFVENQGRGIPAEDYVDDGWTEISRRIREKLFEMPPQEWNADTMMAAFEDADLEKMEQIRARVDSVVQDGETAQNLKAWYNQLCKRPCFHDDYLAAFNAPGAQLIHTDGKGVERVTKTGVVANGTLYDVDCIIYASGFEVGTDYTSRSGFDMKGRGDKMLSEHWADGMRTLHGLHIHGFPNAFMVQPYQAANMISNVPHNIIDHAQTIAQIVSHAEAEAFSEIEPTEDAETAWVDLILSGPGSILGSTECTPGYYNNEGQGWSQEFKQSQGHPDGPKGFFDHIEKWRRSGDFAGLSFTR
ncbi:MAG: NAD(P)/FAD-dependent oxidoreductase [Pseudomonadota bacterium]